MQDPIFLQEKKKFVFQKVESLNRLERTIAENPLPSPDTDGSVERLERAWSDALSAVERLRNANERNLASAVENADQAMIVAYERLEAATQPETA
jgi:flagellar biosynthesis/type III secretory pathway chaperone